MTIRTATLEDVKDIATIHVKAWQAAYKKLNINILFLCVPLR
ncbi:hypothetical protein [Rivularia sp. UHCC 0363]|nr:hypothetical protein [Rivularia sp. UHCC 0363]MEA5594209.1 hypothetical protein [Rivularia sp. UHCC 0363]